MNRKFALFFGVFIALTFVSYCLAAEDIPAPKQVIKYDYSGPYNDLIGMWSGGLSTPESSHNYDYQHKYHTHWYFNLYVISITVKAATAIYCWSAVGKFQPDCRELKGILNPIEDKLVFTWGERILTLLHKQKVGDLHQIIYQKSNDAQFEGLAKKMVN